MTTEVSAGRWAINPISSCWEGILLLPLGQILTPANAFDTDCPLKVGLMFMLCPQMLPPATDWYYWFNVRKSWYGYLANNRVTYALQDKRCLNVIKWLSLSWSWTYYCYLVLSMRAYIRQIIVPRALVAIWFRALPNQIFICIIMKEQLAGLLWVSCGWRNYSLLFDNGAF